MNQSFTPVAQYLRMSADHQQYSLDNQAVQRRYREILLLTPEPWNSNNSLDRLCSHTDQGQR